LKKIIGACQLKWSPNNGKLVIWQQVSVTEAGKCGPQGQVAPDRGVGARDIDL